ncbi:hypothetical protein O181_003880 [Austropuccinia psidii MF-1]|uniref:Uncharacterized protein n=1 Tax=Austropuccinia psidii MF-1 TaxID=1389203 RepID=A0A9Q3BF97_9BASI|nr:hypothetical protein [Austropuccinia psidii MF-1]
MAHQVQANTNRFLADIKAIECMAHTIYLVARDGLNVLGKGGYPSGPQENKNIGTLSISNLVEPPHGINLDYSSIVTRIACLGSYLRHRPHHCKRFLKPCPFSVKTSKPRLFWRTFVPNGTQNMKF